MSSRKSSCEGMIHFVTSSFYAKKPKLIEFKIPTPHKRIYSCKGKRESSVGTGTGRGENKENVAKLTGNRSRSSNSRANFPVHRLPDMIVLGLK